MYERHGVSSAPQGYLLERREKKPTPGWMLAPVAFFRTPQLDGTVDPPYNNVGRQTFYNKFRTIRTVTGTNSKEVERTRSACTIQVGRRTARALHQRPNQDFSERVSAVITRSNFNHRLGHIPKRADSSTSVSNASNSQKQLPVWGTQMRASRAETCLRSLKVGRRRVRMSRVRMGSLHLDSYIQFFTVQYERDF